MSALQQRGLPFSVIVNDFENADIDATRLGGAKAGVYALSGSCVCCSSLQDFMRTLGEIHVPEGGVLLVEANGASDLTTLIAAIAMRHECRRYLSPLQVTLVDATRWQKRRKHNALETEQVRTSTHWMLTHEEGVGIRRLRNVRAAVEKLAPKALETQVEAFASYLLVHARMPQFSPGEQVPTKVDLFLGGQEVSQGLAHEHHHEGERAFTSLRVTVPFVVKRADLESALRQLPGEVVRVKGLCRLAELPQVPFSFQHVRPQSETWFLPIIGALGIIPSGVVIGVGMPAQEIAARFEALPSASLLPEEPLPAL